MSRIVIPVYNEEKRIRDTISSFCDSSEEAGERFELVIVDNGSEDRTTEIIASYLGTTLPLELTILAEPTKGKSHALNTGFRDYDSVPGGFSGFADGDTTVPVDFIQNAISVGASEFPISYSPMHVPREVDVAIKDESSKLVYNLAAMAAARRLLIPGRKSIHGGAGVWNHQFGDAILGDNVHFPTIRNIPDDTWLTLMALKELGNESIVVEYGSRSSFDVPDTLQAYIQQQRRWDAANRFIVKVLPDLGTSNEDVSTPSDVNPDAWREKTAKEFQEVDFATTLPVYRRIIEHIHSTREDTVARLMHDGDWSK